MGALFLYFTLSSLTLIKENLTVPEVPIRIINNKELCS